MKKATVLFAVLFAVPALLRRRPLPKVRTWDAPGGVLSTRSERAQWKNVRDGRRGPEFHPRLQVKRGPDRQKTLDERTRGRRQVFFRRRGQGV